MESKNKKSQQMFLNKQIDDQEDDMNYNEQEQQDYYNDDYDQHYNQHKGYFNQGLAKQNQHYDQIHDQDEDEGEQDQNEYFKYNNFDMFVAKKSEEIKRQPLQVQRTQNYAQNKQTNPRSKSPSISQLPDFLRNQAERSSSYMKRESNNDQNLTNQQRQNERCQKLYELGEKKRVELQQKKRESEILKENDSQCTFRPQSYTKKSMYRAQTQSSLNIFERSSLWNEQKKSKLDQIKEADKNKDLDGCTFQPLIKNSQQSHLVNMSVYPNQNGIGLKGVDKFLRRQIIARRAKEELEAQKENPFCHVENKNISKNIDQIPIPNLTKRTKQSDNVYSTQGENQQNYDQAIKSLRWQLHNIDL